MFKSKALLFASGAAALCSCSGKEAVKPNVVIILADDLGYGDLGCYGAVGVATPHVDSLANAGVRFTNTHAVASTSTPSRYGLLTGQYPWRKAGTDIAAGNAAMIISPDTWTLADMFRSCGYTTSAFGKWHLGLGSETAAQEWNGTLDQDLRDIGFDHYYIMAATADRVPCVFIEDGKVVNYDPDAPITVSYEGKLPGEMVGSEHPELMYNLQPSHGHNMAIVNGIGRIGYMTGGGKALWKDENIADSIAANAVRFIESNSDKPFFMYVATNDIHVPRFPAERFRGSSTMGLRGDAISQFDWTVGEIMAALRRAGVADNTIVILTSDNGPVLDDGYQDRAEELVGEHSPTGHLRGGKYSNFEGGTVVPMIVCWPGHCEAGTQSDILMSQIDIYRSLSSAIGASLPEGAAPDSRDYKDCQYVIEEAFNHNLSVRTPEWKYINPCEGGPMIPWGPKIESGNNTDVQLYDLKADPHETVNVAASHPDIVSALQKILDSERALGDAYPAE